MTEVSGNTKKPGVLGTIGRSLYETGSTALVGGAAGAAVGKAASYIPIKPNQAQINFQYKDMFIKAATNNELPEYLKGQTGDIIDITKNGRSITNKMIDLGNRIGEYFQLSERIGGIKKEEALLKDEALKEEITKIIGDVDDFNKETITKKLKEVIEDAAGKFNGEQSKLDDLAEQFVKKANELNDPKMLENARKGAKHLRQRSIIGVGILAGVIAALTFGLLKSYGIIGGKKQKSEAQQAAPAKSAIQPLYTHQG